MIVVDVGCARYGGDYSIERLIEEFDPETLYGFDPNEKDRAYQDDTGCDVVISGKAAWTYEGTIGYDHPGLSGWLTERRGAKQVRCVDLASFIELLPPNGVMLKIDAEGSEYGLLEHLIDRGVDKLLTLAWVEWHQPDKGRASLEERLSCEVAEWRW